MKAITEYLKKKKDAGTAVKIFLTDVKGTMLSGKITAYDEDNGEAVVLDDCLIFTRNVLSIAPLKEYK